jgi:chloride channel protein, CIC family
VIGLMARLGLAGVLGGVMRSPLTGVVFALELTHRYQALLPLLIVATTAYLVSVLVLRRSVLTEKIARRGLHLSREYSVDPLEVFFVTEVIEDGLPEPAELAVLAASPPVHPDDTPRHVAYRMAELRVTELPAAEREAPHVLVGRITLEQLLAGRRRYLHEERHLERVIEPARLFGFGRRRELEEVSG